MFKFFKYIGLLKDIKAEYALSGKVMSFLASRKVWGLIWFFGGSVARDFFGLKLTDDVLNQGADLALVLFTYASQGFGIAMQVVSYVKTLSNAIKALKEKDMGSSGR